MRFGPISVSSHVLGVSLILAVVLVIVAAFGACIVLFPSAPVRGEVVDKWHEDRREDNSYWHWNNCAYRLADPDGSGPQSGSCMGQMQYAYLIDDEDWVLQVQTFEDDGTKGKVKRREVSREAYYRCEKGDWYDQETKGRECQKN